MAIAALYLLVQLLVFPSQVVLAAACTIDSPTTVTSDGKLSECQKQLLRQNIRYFDVARDAECDAAAADTTSSGGSANIDQVLRTLAFRESGGNPTATNSVSSASGKYQYLDGTWQARKSYYSEVSKYPRAKDAPEAVQDGVAYLEYSEKITLYNGDLFKIALSHFYPAAISDASLLDSHIGGNTVTPRQYADGFVQQYKDDVGASIKLYYSDAPNLPSVSGDPAGSTSSTGGCGNTTDTSSLGVGRGRFTDSGEVKNFANVLANSKASDAAFGDGFVGCGICAAVVSRVWRGQDIGYGINGGTDGAIGMWNQYKGTIGHADRNPKKGAILLYTSSDPAGHVVIYLGDNKVLNDGQIWNAGDLETKWHVNYQGWVDPNEVGWNSIKAPNIRTALASDLDRMCN
jgi:hypothetical protein